MRYWLITLGAAATIGLSACSGSSAPAAPTGAPTPSSASSPTPAAAISPTAAPATPTTIPVTPTVAVSPTAAATPTVESTPTVAATPTPASTPTANAATSGAAVGADEVLRVASAWSRVKSFRIKSDTTGNGQFLGEFVLPDRSHFTITANSQTIEVIRIGPDTYTKINGQWTKQPGVASAITTDPVKLVSDFSASQQAGKKVTKGHTKTVNGVQCQDWIITSASGANESSICIGLQDQLPYQASSANGKAVVDFYDYNAPITINPPI